MLEIFIAELKLAMPSTTVQLKILLFNPSYYNIEMFWLAECNFLFTMLNIVFRE